MLPREATALARPLSAPHPATPSGLQSCPHSEQWALLSQRFPGQQEVLGPSPAGEQSLGRGVSVTCKPGAQRGHSSGCGAGVGRDRDVALTPEEHDCPSVRALALRLSWFHLLTSWDCPLSLSWLLCKAEETEPFLPSLQSLRVRRWALVGTVFPPLCQSSPQPLTGTCGDFRRTH